MNDEARQVLRELLVKYGVSLAEDRGRCSALLHDLRVAHKAEVTVLLAAMDEGIPSALMTQSKSGPSQLLIERLVKGLRADRHLTPEAARWAVESWALALGIAVAATQSRTESAPPKEAPKDPRGGAGQKEKKEQDRSMDDFYKVVTGPKNQNYYLLRFAQFDRQGKVSASWHWPAFFASFYWLLYRKMWRNALIYFLLPYGLAVLLGVGAAFKQEYANAIIGAGYLTYLLGIFVWLPMYATALYYWHCRKQIAQVKASYPHPERQLGELSGKGGTSGIVLFLVLALVFVFFVGLLAAITIPAYQEYIARAQVSEAAGFGQRAGNWVLEYYGEHQQIPNDLEGSGFSEPFPSSVSHVDIDGDNGALTITLAAAPVADGHLVLTPDLDENNDLLWKCGSEDIPSKYLPQACR